MRVTIEMTGETICGECLGAMIESKSPPVDDDPRVKGFREQIVTELARRTGVEPSCISVTCKRWYGHDVSITKEKNTYQITVLYDLMLEPKRWGEARDYLVSWIREHPIPKRTWDARQSSSNALSSIDRFVFIFLPEEFPEPPVEFGPSVAQELCRPIDSSRLGWMVCPVSSGSLNERNMEIVQVLQAWAQRQHQPDTILFNHKTVKFKFATEKCTCVVAQRST